MGEYNANGDGTTPCFSNLAETKPENGLEAAELYTLMGLSVVPCEGKRPILKNWPELRLGLEDLPRHFGDGQTNVGLLLGEPSGGLVVVDIDVPEALTIADRFLEDTLCGGRTSSPRVHRYHQVHGLKSKKWQDTDGVVLLELRATGYQTLVEPSIHPDTGERYDWDREGLLEPVEVDADELHKRCVDLATATVVARHVPVGGRHEYAMAVIGFLMRRLGKEAALEMARAAWHAADAAGPDALWDLDGIANDTERRLAEGDNAFGAPTLEEMVPGLPTLLKRWWGWGDHEREEKAASGKGDRKAPTHDTLRDRWLEKQAAPTAYGQSEWRRYEDGYWLPVHEQIVCREIDEVLIEAKAEGIKPTSGTRASVEKLARARAFVPDEAWDANEDILVCANGTLQISSRILREHRPSDYALSAVPFDYDPEAEAPTWRGFLASTVPEAAPFLQEFAGYALTVDTGHELAVWLYGPPGGGKSYPHRGVQGHARQARRAAGARRRPAQQVRLGGPAGQDPGRRRRAAL